MAVLVVGIAAVVVVLTRPDGDSTATASGTAVSSAPQPTVGASLPIVAPTAAVPSGSAVADDAQFTDPAAVAEVLAAAKSAAQTIDGYDYRTLDADRAAGDAVSTGAFRSRYDASLSGSSASAARASKTVQQATVTKAGIARLSGATATVLALGRLDTTTAQNPTGTSSNITVGVTLQKVGDRWLISDMTNLGTAETQSADLPGTAGLTAAVTAGAHDVVNLLTYTRDDFDADFARALEGLAEPLKSDQAAKKDTLQATMTDKHIDYAAEIRAVGVESVSGNAVLMVLAATGYQRSDDEAGDVTGPLRFEIAMTYTDNQWLVSQYVPLPS